MVLAVFKPYDFFSTENKLAKKNFYRINHNYLELKLGHWLNFSPDYQVKNATGTWNVNAMKMKLLT